jgi:phage shock protein PspC (stress-responsive transcriptional regulator)
MNESDERDRRPGDRDEPAPDEVPTTPAPQVRSSPRRFLRSHDDRIIAGVAGGLGRYFDIDPVIIRIAFGVSVLFGGLGVLAYLAVALFVPSDDGTGAPVEGGRGRDVARVLGVSAGAVVAFGGCGIRAAAGAFVTGLGFGVPVAAVVVLIGVALAVLSCRGGARWLIVPAVALSIGVGVASASDLDLTGGIGDREYRPQSAAAIPDDGYELGIGRLAVDLRGIDWPAQQALDVSARVGAGQLVVAVPSDVCVLADAHAGAGDLLVAGQQADGADVGLTSGDGGTGRPMLRLDADVDLGQITVVNDDNADISNPNRHWDHGWDGGDYGNEAAMRSANTRGCDG